MGARLAQHRGDKSISVMDVARPCERNYNIKLVGFNVGAGGVGGGGDDDDDDDEEEEVDQDETTLQPTTTTTSQSLAATLKSNRRTMVAQLKAHSAKTAAVHAVYAKNAKMAAKRGIGVGGDADSKNANKKKKK